MASPECYKGDLNLEATELRLGLPEQSSSTASSTTSDFKNGNKRSSSDLLTNEHSAPDVQDDDSPPPTKARVVGWPPVRSYRKNNLKVAKFEGSFVKVNIDGAPYMRKIDLKAYKSYADMVTAIENMYKVAINQSDFVPTYQDEDGDWMMAGDVPWEMFVKSCKRIRIMKSAAAKEKGYC